MRRGRVKIPKEFEHLKDRIEETVNKEAEMYNDIYEIERLATLDVEDFKEPCEKEGITIVYES